MSEQQNPTGIIELPTQQTVVIAEPADDIPISDGTMPTPKFIDLEFPFGRPESINWEKINPAGHSFLKEVNLRPWMKSTEFYTGDCAEPVNVYEEMHDLDLKFVRGLIPDVQYRRNKAMLREEGITRFFLNVNVYNMTPFMTWMRLLAGSMVTVLDSAMNPVRITLNPLRPGNNYSIYWDYWTVHERDLIIQVANDTLKHVPV